MVSRLRFLQAFLLETIILQNCAQNLNFVYQNLILNILKKVLTLTKILKYLHLVIWNSLPWEIKSIVAFSDKELEKSIRNLKPDCPCRTCKNCISSVGFVNP